MKPKKIFELLLWNSCNNNCQFCFQKANKNKYPNKFLTDYQKSESIIKAKEFLESEKFEKGSHVLLVGGELFDNKFTIITETVFFNFLYYVIDKMVSKEIDLLYVNTNLIYQNTDYLVHFLNLIKENNLFERLKFTTSYDVYGRFKTEEDRKLVEKNLIKLKELFPDIKIVVNMIMTKQFCEAILEDKLNVKEFKKEFGVEVNTIPYIILKENMAATRDMIYKTLVKLDEQMPGYLRAYIDNVAIDQEKLLFEYDGNEYKFMTAQNTSCGHNENFHLYTTNKDRCFICDMIKLGEIANV